MSLQDWAGCSPRRTGVVSGVGFGIFMGVFFATQGGGAVGVVVDAVFGGAFFGLFMGGLTRKAGRWPGDLSFDSRQRALRAVRRGEVVDDREDARAVLAVAAMVGKDQPLERKSGLIFSLFILCTLGLLVHAAANGSVLGIAWWSASVVFWLFMMWWVPRRRRLQRSNAVLVSASARGLLGEQ